MTYDYYGESGLVGNIVGTVQADATTIRATMKDAHSGAAREPLATTKLFQIGSKTAKFELFLCASHSTDTDGVTTFVGCSRWLPMSGGAATASTGTQLHQGGDTIMSAPSHLAINVLLEMMNGMRHTGAQQFGLQQVVGEDYVTYGYYSDAETFVGMFRRKVADTKIAEFFGSDDAWHNLDAVGAHGTAALIKDHADVDASASDSPSDLQILAWDAIAGKYKPKDAAEILGDAAEAAYSYAEDAEASDSYAITLAPVPTALVDGRQYRFKANTANTGAATLNINALGAKTIKKNNDQDLEDGDIEAGQIVSVVYNADDDVMEWMGSSAGSLTRAQIVTLTGGGNANSQHTHNEFAAGDAVLLASSDAMASYYTWAKVKEMVVNGSGTIRVKFDLATNSAGNAGYGRIYKNGSPLGTTRSTTSITPTTYTEDITVSAGDLVQMWASGTSGHAGQITNFRIYVTRTPTATVTLN